VASIIFVGEFFLFFTKALHEAGHQQQVAHRFLVLSLGVFVTALVAFYGFARRIERTIHLFFGVLLLQPAVEVMAKFVADVQTDVAIAAITGIIGAVLAYVALHPTRPASVAAADVAQALRARVLTA
jgi:uncharacterized membrane protein